MISFQVYILKKLFSIIYYTQWNSTNPMQSQGRLSQVQRPAQEQPNPPRPLTQEQPNPQRPLTQGQPNPQRPLTQGQPNPQRPLTQSQQSLNQALRPSFQADLPESLRDRPIVSQDQWNSFSSSHCALCTDEFSGPAEKTVLPCNHYFHNECIRPHIQEDRSCPVCRQIIQAAFSESEAQA
uniref:RING-type domain-containing protein n=1 Tax=Biomphalaria glabrata TaxID=6526 RepID=A0A2C9LA33_BIOGL